MRGPVCLGTITTTFQHQTRLSRSRMSTRLPPAAGSGGSSSSPKSQYITLYVLLLGIGGGLFVVVVVLYCCKICMGRRFDYMARDTMKDSEAAGGDGGTNGSLMQRGGSLDKKNCVVQYTTKGGPTQILMTGGLQRKVSEEHQNFTLSRSPRDTDGFKTSSTSGGGRSDKTIATPPLHSPHYLTTSTVISIEPAHNRNVSPSSSSSSSLQLDSHHSNQNSELPSPRSPKSRHNSGTLSRCGSRGRASMKSINSSSSFRSNHRPVGGSLKDHYGKTRCGDSLTINQDSSPRRRSVSLRSPSRHPHSRSPQSKDSLLLPFGLYGAGGGSSENSVHAARDRNGNDQKTISDESRLLSTSGQWTPLEAGLDYWRRKHKHKMQLVQHENVNMGKVCYYDMGSMEDIHASDFSDFSLFPEVSIEASQASAMEIQPQQIKHQYRALWELRATLEEEDWAAAKNPSKILRMGGPSLSPTFKIVDGRKDPKENTIGLLASSISYSTEQSPDRDPLSSHTTSFESNTEPICAEDSGPRGSGHKDFHHLGPTSHATLASRRQSYKNVLQNRMKRLNPGVPDFTFDKTTSSRLADMHANIKSETSFDSIETQESTSTDTSRLEAITTSIESTDNTDSTGESHQYQQQIGKLKFRCESGYKSLENGPTSNHNNPRILARRSFSSGNSVDTTSSSSQATKLGGPPTRGGHNASSSGVVLRNKGNNDDTTSIFFAKVGQLPPPPSRNVARKRRDFGRFERHSIGSLDSVREPLDEESCGSGQGDGRAKGSLFYRYFRNPRSNSAYYTRDYSIDKKSDQLFREFSRCDPTFDMSGFTNTTRTKMYARRSSSARGATTTSFDFGAPQQQQRPLSSIITTNTTNNSNYGSNLMTRRASHCAGDGIVDDELPLIASESSRVLPPNSRFHGAGIPIITVDDS